MPLPLLGAAALGAGLGYGGKLIGSIFGNDANERAAEDANRNAERQLAFQTQMYNDQVARMNPFIQTGQRGATEQEAAIRGFVQPEYDYVQKDFSQTNWKDPGYDFRLSEADKAINASTASKGMTLGSGALKALQKRNQDMASQEYANSFDRFMKDSVLRQTQAENAYKRDFDFGQGKIDNWGNVANRGVQAGASIGGMIPDLVTAGQGAMQRGSDATQTAILNKGARTQKLWGDLGSGLQTYLGDYGTNLPKRNQ